MASAPRQVGVAASDDRKPISAPPFLLFPSLPPPLSLIFAEPLPPAGDTGGSSTGPRVVQLAIYVGPAGSAQPPLPLVPSSPIHGRLIKALESGCMGLNLSPDA